ncbi:exocyst complex component 1 isoform X1 [Cloeon dipterum]|uniref:exocyst complex component 1 isoform X1 n=2 Tax=Cloeon dipterum TaxID=197152 RepID=UPI00321FE4C7
MATWHGLQKDVFPDQKMVAMVHVNKTMKKKKSSFLCLTATQRSPSRVLIHQVKQTDRNTFKKKEDWELSELKLVDAKSATAVEQHDFILQFDKMYHWSATNLKERQSFLTSLWKMSNKYLPKQKPAFLNFPEEWQTDVAPAQESAEVTVSTTIVDDTPEYMPLTEREIADLERLMSQCDFAYSNSEAFMETLARDLSILDGKNIHSVLAAEQQVEALMSHLENAISEADKIESQLNVYCDSIQHIQKSIVNMGKKNTTNQVIGKNNQVLLEELENIISQLDVPYKLQKALIEADLNSPNGLKEAIEAGNALVRAMNADLHPALVNLAAVQEQRKRFDKWRIKFSQSICRYLNNLFIHEGNKEFLSMEGYHHESRLTLPTLDTVHNNLKPYAPLMHWLRQMDRKAFTDLSKVYISSLQKRYEAVIRQFFEEARNRLNAGSLRRGKGSSQDISSSGLTPREGQNSPVTQRLLAQEREQWKAADETTDREKFDELLERALTQLEPMFLAEQKFCTAFFQLDMVSPTRSNTQSTLSSFSMQSPGSAVITTPSKEEAERKMEKYINEEVRRMMGELFGSLEPELMGFITYYENFDSFCCMNVLVRLGQHVMLAQDTGNFLSVTFATLLVQVKRNFDKFMTAQIKSIEETKPNRTIKCGILPFVDNFEDFAKIAEKIFQNAERRNDLEKSYRSLMSAIFEAIPRIGGDHQKTPHQVVIMENFHRLHALLSRLKIVALDSYKKEAKQRYQDALKAYVTQYFGRPLEKLNIFCDGIQAKLSQGVKESEVSYQMAYSKQELRKVIKEYPAREVKKGLDSLYRKVEKHLCEEENLLQVVWRAMQEVFIQQYRNVEDLIQRCYPNAMITLEFTIQDILVFFSEIAQSH